MEFRQNVADMENPRFPVDSGFFHCHILSYPNFSHPNHLVAYRDAYSCRPGHFHGFVDHLGPFGWTFCSRKVANCAAMIYLVFVLLWHDVLQTSVYTNRIMVNLLFMNSNCGKRVSTQNLHGIAKTRLRSMFVCIWEKDQKKTFLGIKKNIFSRDQKKHYLGIKKKTFFGDHL